LNILTQKQGENQTEAEKKAAEKGY